MIGWQWEGAAPGVTGCGLSGDEERARRAAEAWLAANPAGTAQFGLACLSDDLRALSASWRPFGERRRSRRLPGGRITWGRVPARHAADG